MPRDRAVHTGMEQCYSVAVDRAVKDLATIVTLVRQSALAETEDQNAFRRAQSAWESYAEAECQTVYAHAAGGSIRSVLAGSCKVGLAVRRAHDLWLTYFPEGTPTAHLSLARPIRPIRTEGRPADDIPPNPLLQRTTGLAFGR